MSATWRRRALGLVLTGTVLGALTLAGLELDPAEVAGAAVVGCVLAWLARDLGDRTSSAGWQPAPRPPMLNRGRDYRLAYLTAALADDLPRTHRILAGVAEQTLLTSYGVSLAEPRARELLGDRVHAFLTEPPAPSAVAYHRELPAALTRIEEL